MTKEAGDNCYDEYDHLWYHVDVAFDCNDYGTVSTPCHYCLKEFGTDEQAIGERNRHEYECGRTLDECIYCGAMVQRKEMEVHYAFSCPYWGNGHTSWEEWKKQQSNLTGGGTTSSSGGATSGPHIQTQSSSFPVSNYIPMDKLGAAFAGYVYCDEDSDTYKTFFDNEGWQEISAETRIALLCHGFIFMDNIFTGFKSTIFEKRRNGKVVAMVYSFAGTDNENWNEIIQDAVTDCLNECGILTDQYKQALLNAELLDLYCTAKGITLTFVGHSLGGGMAALASMLTNRTAITYNPAGALGIRMSVAKFLNIPMNTSHIYAYIMEGDPVTSVQEIFGIHAEGHVKIVTNKKGGSAHSIMNMFENLKRK